MSENITSDISEMEQKINSDFHLLLNSDFVQYFVKPVVIAVGSFFSLKGLALLLWMLYFIYKAYVVPMLDYKYTLREKYGDYVVIINVTDILGAEFAKAFLLRGHSLILIIRKNDNEFEKLKPILEKCRVKGGGEIVVIRKDIDKCDRNIYEEIKAELENSEYRKRIGILLNNSGIIAQREGNFLHCSDELIMDTVHTNVVDFIMITKKVVKLMVDNNRGLIVNVCIPDNCNFFKESSLALTLRQFTVDFNKILSNELYHYKYIKSQVIYPGCLNLGDGYESILNPTPRKFVKSAMEIIGTINTSGYFYHSLRNFLRYIIPDFLSKLALEIGKIKYPTQKDDYEPLTNTEEEEEP